MSYGWTSGAIALVVSGATCWVVSRWALRSSPARFERTNIDGRVVPAVLGWGVAAGIFAGHVVWAVSAYLEYRARLCPPEAEVCADILFVYPWEIVLSLVLLSIGMFGVGFWDDLRGDEGPRGFKGHLAAARGSRWTGGLVKLVGGSVTALVSIWVFAGFTLVWETFLAAACVALTANLINLFDRAPGRAAKVFFLIAAPVGVVASASEIVIAGAIGAMLVAFPLDLRSRAMLGDSGANSAGAFLGFALFLGVIETWGTAGVVALTSSLLALNLASEKWSFSEIIANNRLLARLDHLGRE